MQAYNGFSGDQRARSIPWLNEQYKRWLRPRPTVCLACLQTQGYIATHWENYAEPFGPHNVDYGLCHRCHMMLHMRSTATRLFRCYASLVQQGCQFPVLERRETQAFFPEVRANRLPRPLPVFAAREACWFAETLWDKTWLKVPPLPYAEVRWIERKQAKLFER